MFRVTFTDGSIKDILADGFMCAEKITLFRKRNPKDFNGQPPERRYRIVEEIKTKRIRDIQEITQISKIDVAISKNKA